MKNLITITIIIISVSQIFATKYEEYFICNQKNCLDKHNLYNSCLIDKTNQCYGKDLPELNNVLKNEQTCIDDPP